MSGTEDCRCRFKWHQPYPRASSKVNANASEGSPDASFVGPRQNSSCQGVRDLGLRTASERNAKHRSIRPRTPAVSKARAASLAWASLDRFRDRGDFGSKPLSNARGVERKFRRRCDFRPRLQDRTSHEAGRSRSRADSHGAADDRACEDSRPKTQAPRRRRPPWREWTQSSAPLPQALQNRFSSFG